MKIAVALIFLCLFSPSGFAAGQRFTLDPGHTTVAFLIDHVGYAKTLGYFSEVSGSFVFDSESNELTDIAVTVQTKSVQTNHEARDKHVRNKDFLDVKNHPTMEFVAPAGVIDETGAGEISGELKLLGKSQPMVLTVQLNKADNYPFGHKKFTLGISARGALKRSNFGMDYGVANALVGDAIDLIVETEAIQD